jgi:hypothetical protein
MNGERLCEHFVGGSDAIGDKRVWRSGIFEFCRGVFFGCRRKSLGGRRMHFVGVTGDPILGDIIRLFCRWPASIRSGKPERNAIARRQNG